MLHIDLNQISFKRETRMKRDDVDFGDSLNVIPKERKKEKLTNAKGKQIKNNIKKKKYSLALRNNWDESHFTK